jgi:hypothetical protein
MRHPLGWGDALGTLALVLLAAGLVMAILWAP